jgi:hypothetical protein
MPTPKVNQFKGLAIVATYLSPGVAAGAGGFAIVNGKMVKIPPRGPAYALMQQALKALTKTAGAR